MNQPLLVLTIAQGILLADLFIKNHRMAIPLFILTAILAIIKNKYK